MECDACVRACVRDSLLGGLVSSCNNFALCSFVSCVPLHFSQSNRRRVASTSFRAVPRPCYTWIVLFLASRHVQLSFIISFHSGPAVYTTMLQHNHLWTSHQSHLVFFFLSSFSSRILKKPERRCARTRRNGWPCRPALSCGTPPPLTARTNTRNKSPHPTLSANPQYNGKKSQKRWQGSRTLKACPKTK